MSLFIRCCDTDRKSNWAVEISPANPKGCFLETCWDQA